MQQPGLTRETNDSSVQSIRYVPTADAYDLWSEVYDSDGNFLQALDTIEMKRLLPSVMTLGLLPDRLKTVDLGCGTGRNTLRLLDFDQVHEITALDLSPNMLNVAREKVQQELSRRSTAKKVNFGVFDMLESLDIPSEALNADLVISTLVLEHVPIDTFFRIASRTLKPGGVFLVTNMHSDMGKISQAGFVDIKTGEKVRPTSYAHTVEQVKIEAEKQGFGLLGVVEEIGIDQALAEQLGSRAKKWVGITVWFGGIWQKRS